MEAISRRTLVHGARGPIHRVVRQHLGFTDYAASFRFVMGCGEVWLSVEPAGGWLAVEYQAR